VDKEQRWFRVSVRECGAIGRFYRKDFCLSVSVTGSHWDLMAEAIVLIRGMGYETQGIVSHSLKKRCL